MPAYYFSTVREFLGRSEGDVLLALTRGFEQDRFSFLYTAAIPAWTSEVAVLRSTFQDVISELPSAAEWGLLLEFWIPRRMRRIDAVVLIRDAIVVLEFKESNESSQARVQVQDYALDLSDFHGPSHGRNIYPAVVSPQTDQNNHLESLSPRSVATEDLSSYLLSVAQRHSGDSISLRQFNDGAYKPVPTIVEAAQAMFADMQVEGITHSEAGVHNLSTTLCCVRDLVNQTLASAQKAIVFVTGVPGAGKTLVGLKLVHDQSANSATRASCSFLSGNEPLVEVLRAALAWDRRRRHTMRLRVAERDPATLIQHVYTFKKTEWPRSAPPDEKVIVFDEAQRAWNAPRNSKYYPDAGVSEPEMLLSIMDRHDSCVIVALVGSGQEIHDGEAGIEEWGTAISKRFKDWKVYSSQEAITGEAAVSKSRLFLNGTSGQSTQDAGVTVDRSLHLDIPTRQLRGATVAKWAGAVVEGQEHVAASALEESPDFPLLITRSLDRAKKELCARRQGTQRMGLLASSGAGRLRPYGIETHNSFQKGVPIAHWFLAGDIEPDVRSSNVLEVAVTEFKVQGLEIDWVAVCWGGDFLMGADGRWVHKWFHGNRWLSTKDARDRDYTANSYRVLLTRARRGMVIWVPPGDGSDSTRMPEGFDRTAKFLALCGAQSID